MRSAAVGHQCPDCVKQGSSSQRPLRAAYGGRATRQPYVTYALIGVNVVMLLLTTSGGNLLTGGAGNSLFQKLALQPCLGPAGGPCYDGVATGDYYRLLTSMFLHFGIIHLALNMYGLFLLGPVLEQAFGRLRFAATYLLSGLGGAALSYALGPQNEFAAGASGAVFGLFGAFYVLSRKRNLDVTSIVTTIALNLVLSFSVSGIDWRGHVGGLVAGGALAFALVYSPDTRQRPLYQAAGVALTAVVVAAVVVARTAQLS